MPYWLKGGIIALIIYTPVFFIFTRLEPLSFLILEIPAFPILIFLSPLGIELSGTSGQILLFFILLICYFFIGAIIGFMAGKVKSRNRI